MLLIALTLLAPDANALDIDTFSLASSALDGQGGLQVESPTLGWPGAFYGGLGVVYAHAPLIRVFEDGTEAPVVTDAFATRLAAGYTLLGTVRLGLDLPLYPYVGGPPDASYNGVSIGDARLRGVVRLPIGGEGSAFSLAVVPTLTLPTGEVAAYMGNGSVGGGLGAAAGYRVTDQLQLAANLGFRAGQASALGDQAFGSSIDVGVGGSYAIREDFGVGVEIDGAVDLAGGLGRWMDNPFEVHAYGRYGKRSGLQAMLGVGTGLVGGVGAPDVRVLAAVGWRLAGQEPVYDTDSDGIYDDTDACVQVPEDIDGFEDRDGCPDEDNDGDGILDDSDACRDDAEDRDGWQDLDGCPDEDNDGDGLLDPDDACPDEAGAAVAKGCPDRDEDTVVDREDDCPDVPGLPELGGCPDRDGDRVPEPRDQCPDEAIDPREDPTRSDGCPRRVFVTMEKIEILEKVFFDTNKTTIKKQSHGLLADVAKILNDNPDILTIEVAGHTDNVGNDKANQKLSQGRAEAVVKHLSTVGGVDASRLVAMGYGEMRPIDTNATEAGRGNNRRVEFVIKAITGKRTPLGPAPMEAPPGLKPAEGAPEPAKEAPKQEDPPAKAAPKQEDPPAKEAPKQEDPPAPW